MSSFSNTKKLRLAYLFIHMMVMVGFLSPYLIDHGISATTIMFSQSFYMGVILLLEVPSGIIGDKYGGTFLYRWGGYSLLLMITILTSGIGVVFFSGIENRKERVSNREKEFKHLMIGSLPVLMSSIFISLHRKSEFREW